MTYKCDWYHIHLIQANGLHFIDSVKVTNEAELVAILIDYVEKGAVITNIINAPIEMYEAIPLTDEDYEEMARLFGGEA